MARTFNGTTGFGEYAGGVVTATPLTLAIWFNPAASVSGTLIGLYNSTTNGTNLFKLFISGTVSGVTAQTANSAGGSNVITTTHIAASGWQHACGVFASATSRTVYLNGGSKANQTTSRIPSGINTTDIARQGGSSPGSFLACTLAEAVIYNIDLNDPEVAALAAGMSPLQIRPGNLAGYWPLQGIDSPERDWTVNNHQMTLAGAPAAVNHAPVQPYSARFWGGAPQADVGVSVPTGWYPFYPDLTNDTTRVVSYH